MLDENLPAFFLKPSTTGVKHHKSFYLSHHGSDPAPAYELQHADPQSPSPAHKNCYAAALFDAYNPEVLFGEVLARPTWTQPTLSQEEVRRNGGIPPPPQPSLPTDFNVQLYNPDQQVTVAVKEGKWGASDSYEFSMPETTFRQPSASSLDRGQSDPASIATTPKINFVWRKESKFGSDLTCFMTGKSTDTAVKKKSKRDPDIAVALWRSMRELTIYEPNLSRIDIEDPKGFECVLLLSAVVIKDLYFSGKEHMRDLFNLGAAAGPRKLSAGGRKLSNPEQRLTIVGAPNPLATHPPGQPSVRSPNDIKRNSLPKLQTTPPPPPRGSSAAAIRPPPAADPRQQWELDAETARLKAQAEAEAKQARARRREREKAEEAERKRLQRMVEDEERQARNKQAEVDKETERLRKLYGVQPVPQRPQQPQRPNTSRQRPAQSGPYLQPIPQGRQPKPPIGSNGLPIYGNAAASSSAVMMTGANGNASTLSVNKPAKKKSFFGLRSASDEQAGKKLNKKSSAMW